MFLDLTSAMVFVNRQVRVARTYLMKTAVIKRSIFINGRKTSISLENEFWVGLHEIAKSRKTTAAKLVGEIDRQRTTINMSSAIRTYVYNYFRSIEGEHAETNPAQLSEPPELEGASR